MTRLRPRSRLGRIHRTSTLRGLGRPCRRSSVPARWVPVADCRCRRGRRTRCGREAHRCRRRHHRLVGPGLPLRSTQRHHRRLRGPRDTDCRWSRHHRIWTDAHVRDEGGVDGVRSCHNLGQKVILVRVARSSSRSLPRVIERICPTTTQKGTRSYEFARSGTAKRRAKNLMYDGIKNRRDVLCCRYRWRAVHHTGSNDAGATARLSTPGFDRSPCND